MEITEGRIEGIKLKEEEERCLGRRVSNSRTGSAIKERLKNGTPANRSIKLVNDQQMDARLRTGGKELKATGEEYTVAIRMLVG